jgi:hypothetical protein
MATIGSVTKRDDGRYEGELKTLSVRADITLLPVGDKVSPSQPDYRVVSQGIEMCRLDSHRSDLRQGVRLAVDLGSRARLEDTLRQPRSGRGSDRSRRLRSDLEPAGLSATSPSRRQRRGGSSLSLQRAHPPTLERCVEHHPRVRSGAIWRVPRPPLRQL